MSDLPVTTTQVVVFVVSLLVFWLLTPRFMPGRESDQDHADRLVRDLRARRARRTSAGLSGHDSYVSGPGSDTPDCSSGSDGGSCGSD